MEGIKFIASHDAYKLAACNLPSMVGFLMSSDARNRLSFL